MHEHAAHAWVRWLFLRASLLGTFDSDELYSPGELTKWLLKRGDEAALQAAREVARRCAVVVEHTEYADAQWSGALRAGDARAMREFADWIVAIKNEVELAGVGVSRVKFLRALRLGDVNFQPICCTLGGVMDFEGALVSFTETFDLEGWEDTRDAAGRVLGRTIMRS